MLKKLTCFLIVLVFIFTMGMNVFAAAVGQQLTAPETGWKRIDDTDPHFQYVGGWAYLASGTYGDGFHYNTATSSKVTFTFYGTKLRLLSYGNQYYDTNITVVIDGVTSGTYSCANMAVMTLAFDINNLTLGKHNVEIIAGGGGSNCMSFDCIDIDDTGYFLDANAPAIPTGFQALGGNSKVDLSWAATTGSAITYNVKRSITAGGPYTTITTTSAISYSDSTVITGTTYYYVVSAINSSGESENSNEASATPIEPPVVGGNNAILELTLTNGFEKEYDLTATELQDFISWYDNRSSGAGKAYYTFNIKNDIKPFLSRKEYISFDKIFSFEVKEYNE